MSLYFVNYRHIYPGAPKNTVKTSIVQADSFNDAQGKLEASVKKEYESAQVLNITLQENISLVL